MMTTVNAWIYVSTADGLTPHCEVHLGTNKDPVRYSILSGNDGPKLMKGCLPGAQTVIRKLHLLHHMFALLISIPDAYSTCLFLEALCDEVRIMPFTSIPPQQEQDHAIKVWKSTTQTISRIQLRPGELFCVGAVRYCWKYQYQPTATRPIIVDKVESDIEPASNTRLAGSDPPPKGSPAHSPAEHTPTSSVVKKRRRSTPMEDLCVAAEESQEGAVRPIYRAPTFCALAQTPPSRTTNMLEAIPSSCVKIKTEELHTGEQMVACKSTILDSTAAGVKEATIYTFGESTERPGPTGGHGASALSRDVQQAFEDIISDNIRDTPCPIRGQSAFRDPSDYNDCALRSNIGDSVIVDENRLDLGNGDNGERMTEEEPPRLQSFILKLKPSEEAKDTQESNTIRGVCLTDAAHEFGPPSSNPINQEDNLDDQQHETRHSSTGPDILAAEDYLRTITHSESIVNTIDTAIEVADNEDGLEEPAAKRPKRVRRPSRKLIRQQPSKATTSAKVASTVISKTPPDGSAGSICLQGLGSLLSQPLCSQQTDGSTIDVKPPRKRLQELRDVKSTPMSATSTSINSQNNVSYSLRSSARSSSRCIDTGPSVLFGSSTTVDTTAKVMGHLRKAGVRVAGSVDDCDYLCIGRGPVKITANLVIAIASGKQIVTEDWARQSAIRNELLDPAEFLAEDSELEKSMGLTLAEAIERGTTEPKPLAGLKVYFTPVTKKDLGGKTMSDFKEIAELGGATVESRAPKSIDDKTHWIIVSSENDPGATKLVEEGWRCYSKDIIKMSVLRSVLDLDSDEFVIGAQDVGVPSAAPKSRNTKRKR